MTTIIENDNLEKKAEESINNDNEVCGEYNGIKYTRKDVYKVEENKSGLKPMPEEHFELLMQMPFNSLKLLIQEFEETQSVDALNSIHINILQNNLSENPSAMELLMGLVIYLKNDNLYSGLCALFSDLSHLNLNFSSKLVESQIFSFLDFNKKISTNLVFSLCDHNLQCWEEFKRFYLERGTSLQDFNSDPLVNALISQHDDLEI